MLRHPLLRTVAAIASLASIVAGGLAGPAAAAPPADQGLAWERSFNGDAVNDLERDVDLDGGVAWSVGVTGSGAGRDAVVRRLDASTGRVLSRRLEGDRRQADAAVAVDAGPWGAVVLGTTGGVFPHGGGDRPPRGEQEYWIQRLARDGSVVWTRQLPGAVGGPRGYLRGISVGARTVYVVGGAHRRGHRQDYRVTTLSLGTGVLGRGRTFGTAEDDDLDASVVAGGQLLVTGVSDDPVGDGEVVVAALDLVDLHTRWIRQLSRVGDSVAITADAGSIYLAGAEYHQADDTGSLFLPSGVVSALEPDGSLRWRYAFGEGFLVTDVAAVPAGVVIAGEKAAGAELPGPPTRGGGGGGQDVFIQDRAAADGAEQWTRAWGWKAFDAGGGLVVGDGRAVVAGYSVRKVGPHTFRDRGRLTAYDLPE